jgi:hypothetical protein
MAHSPEVQQQLNQWRRRQTDKRFFTHGKPGHLETIEQWTDVYSDKVEVRARVQFFLHSDKKTVRSVQRLVTDQSDMRLRAPNATNVSNWVAKLRKRK